MRIFAACFPRGALVLLALITITLSPTAAERKATEAVDTQATLTQAPLRRTVLGIYHSDDEAAPSLTRLHKFVEMPLNHLGYTLTYWDLKRGVPPAELTASAGAVATWFAHEVPGSGPYLTWAAKTAQTGTRFVIFESTAASGRTQELPAINALLAHLGLKRRDAFVSDVNRTRVVKRDKAIVGYERPLFSPLLPFPLITVSDPAAQGPQAEVLLSVDPPNDKDDAVLIATSSGGGFIASGYAIHFDQGRSRLAWVIDPIAFLSKALGTGVRPVPDTTTLAGRRIYFSHIDGDGWNANALFEPYFKQGLSSAEVVRRELIVPYPDLPVTIGLISCDIDPALKGKTEGAETARQLYALPQVEAASHTHTHPFDWKFFENYSRSREMARLNPPAPPRAPPVSTGGFFDAPAPKPVARPAPPAGDPPRYNSVKPFDIGSEVPGSLATVQSLLPEGKKPALYLWSGDTRPFEAAIRATRTAGVRNMNGGDSRLDKDFPSIAYVPALSRMIGKERQIYAGNSNENTYTNGWKPPYDGFVKLRETLDRTDAPRRLKPMNLYYHMYSGEQAAALAAVKGHLDYARRAAVIPIPASQYTHIADSFFDVTMTETAPMRWSVANRGALQTLRFDAAEGLMLDFDQSAGVLGETRHNKALYVALDPANAAPQVALKPRREDIRRRPHLIESRWQLSALDAKSCDVTAKAIGFGPGEMTWGGFETGRSYRIEAVPATAPGIVAPPSTLTGLTANAEGRLSVSLPADARAGAAIRITCAADTKSATDKSATE